MKAYEHKIINGIELKKCTKCNKWKSITEFNKCKNHVDGLINFCRDCRNKIKREYYQKNKKIMNKQHGIWAKNNPDKVKPIKEKYRKANRQKLRKRGKEYREKNREIIRKKGVKAVAKWKKKHPERYKETYKKQGLRRSKDPKCRLYANISSGMRGSIRKGSKNGRCWETLVGYTVDQLIKRLKKTLPKGYIWQDYLDGKLHIDHIIPKSVFNFTKYTQIDFRKCWALKNLQLLPAEENLIKGAKLKQPFQPSLKMAY